MSENIRVDNVIISSSPTTSDVINVDNVISNLEALIADPLKISDLSEDRRIRLLKAVGTLSLPFRGHSRGRHKLLKRKRLDQTKFKDISVLSKTQMRKIRSASTLVKLSSLKRQNSSTEGPGALTSERKCYVCKTFYRNVHFFYDSMCESCATVNYRKRHQTANLSGRVALVTGGRVKIGYETVLKLLRCNAHVVVTTRFPNDAADRYSREDDFHEWQNRLEIFGLDLRHTRGVELFARFLTDHLPRLDFVIHNACQTIRRPVGFYRHLIDFENCTDLNPRAKAILGTFVNPTAIRVSLQIMAESNPQVTDESDPNLDSKSTVQTIHDIEDLDQDQQQLDMRHISVRNNDCDLKSLPTSSHFSQLVLLPEDGACDKDMIPDGHSNLEQQRLDWRPTNVPDHHDSKSHVKCKHDSKSHLNSADSYQLVLLPEANTRDKEIIPDGCLDQDDQQHTSVPNHDSKSHAKCKHHSKSLLPSAHLSQFVLLPKDIVCDREMFPYGHLDRDQKQMDLRRNTVQVMTPDHDSKRLAKCKHDSKRLLNSADLSQLALLPEDNTCDMEVFPVGHLDQDQQQLDLRLTNSWRYRLADVPTVEVVETQLVNAVAPFVLTAKLKPLMLKYENRDKHIVNVSAMEGQFYRSGKTDRHPHTNMAKAALNMMTRTSACDYAKDGIHMNSVDTGWVSEENPVQIAQHKKDVHDFHPPLDTVDGAARILDPIIDGFNTSKHQYGCFFKDYKPTVW